MTAVLITVLVVALFGSFFWAMFEMFGRDWIERGRPDEKDG